MGVKSFFAKILAHIRAKQLRKISSKPVITQQKVFDYLIKIGKNTVFGQDFGFQNIQTIEEFQHLVPIRDYEKNKSYFERIKNGEENILWKGKPLYLAKTSGTTSGAKYIPITTESIRNQISSARDILLMYIYHTSNASFLEGKMMFLSGSPVLETNAAGVKIGRLSGIVNHFVPAYLQTNRVPSFETNCIEDWEIKVKTIVSEVIPQDLRLMSGIPPWIQMFFEEAEDQTGKKTLDIWQNLQIFIHGGVDFSAYREVFNIFFQHSQRKMPDMLELYPASEGFFAFQDDWKDEGLLLVLDGGIFYEFIPLEEYGKPNPSRLTIKDVQLHQQYALVVSTNAGLWAYDVGDTIKFVSLTPPKIRVTGRVKHFLSLFGEHIITEEVVAAIQEAAKATNAVIQEFTAAPFLSPEKGESFHEWFVEFKTPPAEINRFQAVIDASLQQKNPYYRDLREGKLLKLPKINSISPNACREYMKAQGKLGGQNKFPNLSNDRKIADFLTNYITEL